MRKLLIFFIGILLLSSCTTTTTTAQEEGYKIKVQIEGVNNDTIYLANYYGKKLYYTDTAYAQGDVVYFEGDSLMGGKYAIVLLKPEVKYFEFIVAEPEISIKTNRDDFLGSMEIIKSEENKVFYGYVQFLTDRKDEMIPYENQLKDFQGSKEEKEEIISHLRAINDKVIAEQHRIVEEYDGMLVAEFINMGIQIKIPDPPKDENGVITDSLFQRRYYVNHYFDHFDFMDDRISHDAIYFNKINDFFTKVVYPTADSIIYYGDDLINRTNKKGDNFKFIANYLSTMFDKQKRMGLDAVFVHIVETYYMNDMGYWLDSAGTAKLTEKAMSLKPILIGKKAPYINLYDTTGTKRIPLYDVKADYTILYFWASDCGHCQKSTPKLLETYHKYKDRGVEVYAVGTELENDLWIKYINDHDFDFINVSDLPKVPDYFRTHYDIFATPKIFILDKDKVIIGKDIGVEQIDQFLEFEMNRK
jgi:peroxiredoxin